MSKFYITTAIDYINGSPHIGHAVQKVWSDVIARYKRMRGMDVFFLTGTDEHGINIQKKAEELGMEPQKMADENSLKFRGLKDALDLSWDEFIRTTDKEKHWPGVLMIWKKLFESGDIYKAKYTGLYCNGHESFITQKDMEGDNCILHQKPPDKIEEENYFFKLSKYTEQIKRAIESDEFKIIPISRKHEILALIGEGLEDVSFSRSSKDLHWGIPVPGDDSQTMYVWADALTNYISAIGYGRNEDWKKLWPADLHVLGKDNLRFHAAIWPGMLLAAGVELPKALLVHGFLQVGGRKMSKTLGNVVDPYELVEHFGKEAVRYYFAREITIFDDGDFTQEKFERAYEGNLVNGLGNYIQRISTMIRNYFPEGLEKPGDKELQNVALKRGETEFVSVEYFTKDIIAKEYNDAMDGLELNKAIDKVFELLKELDVYVQRHEPFKLVKTDKEKARAILWNLAYGAVGLAYYLTPFLPETSNKIFDIFGIEDRKNMTWTTFKAKEHKALFPRHETI